MRRWFALATIAAAAAMPAHAQTTAKTVQAPHYGDTLFQFFQDKHFEAITGLMVSQHFTRLAPHDDESEVLRGGMLLSYGLHLEAGEVFAKLIERNAAPAVRDRAWYFLAKIRWQRGLVAESETALAKVENPLKGGLEDDRQLLRAQLRMAQGDYAQAATILETIKDSPTAGLFARFNLGVSLVRTGDGERGNQMLDAVGKTEKAATEEVRALRDRANVALGFAALQDKKPEQARAVLQRVRLKGPQSNKALLGFGWAAAELKKPEDALVPWTELAERDTADAAVLEAKIALPYAYAELGALGQAMDGYQSAITTYEAEAKRLDESIAAIRQGALVCTLLEKNPSNAMGAFGSINELGDVPKMPHVGHLSTLVASHDFQEAFKNLRDLQFLQRNLAEWQAKLVVFGDMLANRRQAYAERLPQVLQRAVEMSLPALQQRRYALAAEFSKAEETQDGTAFADERQRGLLDRLRAMQGVLATVDDPELKERARRVIGALNWELARQFPERVWDAKKGLRDTDLALAQAGEREAALKRAQVEEPARFEQFAQRIAALAARLNAGAPQLASLSKEQQGQLQDLAIAELQAQKERLDVYAAQARLAIAQLHDRAQVADAKR